MTDTVRLQDLIARAVRLSSLGAYRFAAHCFGENDSNSEDFEIGPIYVEPDSMDTKDFRDVTRNGHVVGRIVVDVPESGFDDPGPIIVKFEILR